MAPSVAPNTALVDASVVAPSASPSAPAPAPAALGTLGTYTFQTFDGYGVSTDTLAPVVVIVWSTDCKPCTDLRQAASEISTRRPDMSFLSVSRDAEPKWRAALKGGSRFIEVRDAGLVKDMAAKDGTVMLIGPDHRVRWRGDWSETNRADLEKRIAALSPKR